MNDQQLGKKLRHAVETRLSSMESDPWLTQRVLNTAQEIPCRRTARKISGGIILLIVLILVVASAVAAISLKGLHEKAIEIAGEDGLVVGWSAEQKISFVDWMVEAGIELDANQVAKLHRSDLSSQAKDAIALKLILDYYPSRDGTLTTVDIIAKEKGPIEFWSVEDKAWYDDMQAYFHPEWVKESCYLLPNEDELSQEAALAIFKRELAEKFQIAEKSINFSTLTTSFGEYTFDIGEGPYKLRCWFFCVQLVDGNEASVWINAAEGNSIGLSVTHYI